MLKASLSTKKLAQAQSGFTLVELVTVVLILSILSVYVVPRFLSTEGFAERSTQQRLLAALRALQTKAMHDTSSSFCYRMIFNTSSSPAYGPSVGRYVSGTESASCGGMIATDAPENLALTQDEFSRLSLSLAASDSGVGVNYIQFDALGRPTTSAGTCNSFCQISLLGQTNTTVCIGSEGYIHVC
ncbi:pilus assembly FimT family protein [Agaribacter flavus]|uniref:Tfp pilus assembly protein FimT/FimU n=1 Tax=Agaribacter flavus TaxID=1902781 RepID=A0ABV7FUV2_9ALTE